MIRLTTATIVMSLSLFVTANVMAENLPNLTPFPASDLVVEPQIDGKIFLRFTTLSWNNGTGPLELIAGNIDKVNGKQEVFQRIYSTPNSYRDVLAGSFDWHDVHRHIHFNDYAIYTLQSISANGSSARTAAKTTFCIVDTTPINTKIKGSPKRPFYTTCGLGMQGMSVGWGDQYGYYLDGQSLDITNLANGDYNLKIEVDPKNRITESNETDNTSTVVIRIIDGTVSLFAPVPVL